VACRGTRRDRIVIKKRDPCVALAI
jgi:hypothetical protein